MSNNQGKAGFGLGEFDLRTTNQQKSQQELLAAAGNHTALLQLIESHMRRLAEKYDEPLLEQANSINIPGSATLFSQKIDLSTLAHNSVLICVTAGTLNLWLGDYIGMPQAAIPNAGSYAAVSTTQLFFGLKGRVYSIVNPSTTVALTGSLVPLAI